MDFLIPALIEAHEDEAWGLPDGNTNLVMMEKRIGHREEDDTGSNDTVVLPGGAALQGEEALPTEAPLLHMQG